MNLSCEHFDCVCLLFGMKQVMCSGAFFKTESKYGGKSNLSLEPIKREFLLPTFTKCVPRGDHLLVDFLCIIADSIVNSHVRGWKSKAPS